MKTFPRLLLALSLLTFATPSLAERRKTGETAQPQPAGPTASKKTTAKPKTPQTQYLPVPKAKIVEKEPAKAGFFSKLWPFGGEKTEQPSAAPQQPKAPAKPAPKPVVVKSKTGQADTAANQAKLPFLSPAGPANGTPAPQQAADPAKKPGFFSRIFGGGDSEPKKPTWTAVSENSVAADASDKPLRPDDWETKAVVTDQDTEAYLFGPSQSFADAKLAKGSLVTMKDRGKSWSEVILEDGRTVTVASDQIRMAAKDDFRDPPPPIVAINPPLPEYLVPLQTDNVPQPELGELLPSSGESLLTPAKQP